MSISAQQVVNLSVEDPNAIAETFANGPFNLNILGSVATLTFTSVRPDVTKMFSGNANDLSAIVVSRLTMPVEHLVQLRQLLAQVIVEPSSMPPAPMANGSTLKQ